MDKREYKALSELAANGDTKSFARLYETLYREMYYAAYYSLSSDADAVEVVNGAVRDCFSVIARLRSEGAFRNYIMKTLCARIKEKFKQYAENDTAFSVFPQNNVREEKFDAKRVFMQLNDTQRLVASLYVGGKFLADEISTFTGIPQSTVKKQLERALEVVGLVNEDD